jgi:hypothetical protein
MLTMILRSLNLRSVNWRFSGIALACMISTAATAHAAGFIDSLGDVPLMDGYALDGEPLIFETAQGRILEAAATGWPNGEAAAQFYAATLPNLGWSDEGAGLNWSREAERLELTFDRVAPGTTRASFRLIVRPVQSGLE